MPVLTTPTPAQPTNGYNQPLSAELIADFMAYHRDPETYSADRSGVQLEGTTAHRSDPDAFPEIINTPEARDRYYAVAAEILQQFASDLRVGAEHAMVRDLGTYLADELPSQRASEGVLDYNALTEHLLVRVAPCYVVPPKGNALPECAINSGYQILDLFEAGFRMERAQEHASDPQRSANFRSVARMLRHDLLSGLASVIENDAKRISDGRPRLFPDDVTHDDLCCIHRLVERHLNMPELEHENRLTRLYALADGEQLAPYIAFGSPEILEQPDAGRPPMTPPAPGEVIAMKSKKDAPDGSLGSKRRTGPYDTSTNRQ